MTEETLFELLINTPEAERSALLDRECAGQPQLRQRLDDLLKAHRTTKEKHQSPLPVTTDGSDSFNKPDLEVTGGFIPSSPSETITMVLEEKYQLLEKIGEGGMGEVWVANQTSPIKRKVAIKLIRSGIDSRAVIARFDAERQALAIMDHPNIARVLDGGTTPSGQPFFVMELVDGTTITTYCDNHRLSVKFRLELFVQVCQAVQHAHQKGIIHRDLKPGNVLVTEVDGRPTPKVIDFGVAKATEQKLTDMSYADTGVIVGTPTYMSPEQADPSSMDIDTRTDVYALGVILYELLAGSPPIEVKQFRRGAILEMLRMVREVEPPRPSTKVSTADALPSIAATRGVDPTQLKRVLKGDLDWIVMKALEKDRNRRYESANGFAADILRYLSYEPVLAAPPSRAYRVRKFIRKNRGPVIAASLVVLALIVGLIGTIMGLLEAKTQKVRAEENFATARALILTMGTQINQIESSLKNPKLVDLARQQALDEARKQFDQFRASLPDDATIQVQAATLHRFAANVSRTLSDFPTAKNAYTESIQILEQLIAKFPDQLDNRYTLALTLSDRAMLEKRMGLLKDSSATLDRAWKLIEETQGNFLLSNYHRIMGWIEHDRASIANLLGQFKESAQLAIRSRELFDKLKDAPFLERQALDPLLVVWALNNLAISQRELGQIPEAITAHQDAIARMKKLIGPKSNRDELYWGCEVRRALAGTVIAVPDQRATVATDLIEVIRISEKLVEDYPEVAFYREKLAATYLYRGELLALLGQLEPASEALTKSLAISRELIDRFGVLSASMLVRGKTFLAIGRVKAGSGKKDDAVTNWNNAAKVFEIALKIDPDNFHHRRGLEEANQALKMLAK